MTDAAAVAEVTGTIIYAYVDRVGEKPFRQDIAVSQREARSENGIKIPAQTDILRPNREGIFMFPATHWNARARVAALEAKKTRDNVAGAAPRIIGPFKTIEEALKQRFVVRPKTPTEAAELEREARVKAEALLVSSQSENEALRARIAALESAKASSKPASAEG